MSRGRNEVAGSVAPAASAFGWCGSSRQRLRSSQNRCALTSWPVRTIKRPSGHFCWVHVTGLPCRAAGWATGPPRPGHFALLHRVPSLQRAHRFKKWPRRHRREHLFFYWSVTCPLRRVGAFVPDLWAAWPIRASPPPLGRGRKHASFLPMCCGHGTRIPLGLASEIYYSLLFLPGFGG